MLVWVVFTIDDSLDIWKSWGHASFMHVACLRYLCLYYCSSYLLPPWFIFFFVSLNTCHSISVAGRKWVQPFYLVWWRNEPSRKEVIQALLKKINDEKKKTFKFHKREGEVKVRIKLLKGLYVFVPWVLVFILTLALISILIMKWAEINLRNKHII